MAVKSVQELHTKLTQAQTRNSRTVSNGLDELRTEGIDTKAADIALDAYQTIDRAAFPDATEYSNARTQAWSVLMDAIAALRKQGTPRPSHVLKNGIVATAEAKPAETCEAEAVSESLEKPQDAMQDMAQVARAEWIADARIRLRKLDHMLACLYVGSTNGDALETLRNCLLTIWTMDGELTNLG